MKKLFYSFIVAAIAMVSGTAHAQYTITSSSVNTYPDSTCSAPFFALQSSGFTAGLNVHTYYGDGTNDVNPLFNGFIGGIANYYHTYTSAGTYTIKQVLELGGVSMDSVITSYNYAHCQTLHFIAYNDVNGNCVYDTLTENRILMPMSIAVDSNGVRVDTFVTTSGFGYQAYGNPGDIYAFSVINSGTGLVVTCPVGGVLYDTISATVVNDYVVKEFGFNCSSSIGYDAGEVVSTRAGRHTFYANIIAYNRFCNPAAVTVTMNMSPKYNYYSAYPAPASVVGHTITWNFPAMSALTPQTIIVYGETPSTWLVAGDTVHSSYYVTPTAGDGDLSNNTVILVDTVTSSFDPNDKAVFPKGWLAPGAGTKLTYTLRFENTGNDTAFNIHLLDTLSNNLDVRTLAVVGASHTMNLNIMNVGGQNIVKFDFPHVNLLDSSYHGLCDGAVTFSIKTRDALPLGTQIHNRAGIYFDYNDVVMTNTVTNIVGWPAGIEDMSNVATAPLELFPNPASNELTVKITNGNYSTISVINSVGQEVMKQEVNGINTKLNIKALPAGGYYISVKGNSGVKVERFQKI